MTLTPIRPEAGFGKGRETIRRRLSHASWSISAFRLVLSAL